MVDTDDTRRTTDDGRRTTDDGRRTTPRVWHKLPTGELKNNCGFICRPIQIDCKVTRGTCNIYHVYMYWYIYLVYTSITFMTCMNTVQVSQIGT